MIARNALPLMLMFGAAAGSAATLPLRPGRFVLVGATCRDPALAAMFTYDGRQFSYPHATQCKSVVRSHREGAYRVVETCSALGDGSPAKPTTTETSYRVRSATHVRVSHSPADAGAAYRWCPSPASMGKL